MSIPRSNAPPPARFVTGYDLISELGLSPGPKLGKILHEIERAADEGTIHSRREALELARKIILLEH